MFQNLRVVGIGGQTSFQATVSSTVNPLEVAKSLWHIRHPPTRNILNGFEGVVTPGEMLRKAYLSSQSWYECTNVGVVQSYSVAPGRVAVHC